MERRFSLLRHDHSQRITAANGIAYDGAVARYWSGAWTPVLAGGTTPGTYELATATGRWQRVGNLVHVAGLLLLAGTITGGGTGQLIVNGLPFAPQNDVPMNWWGTLYHDALDLPGTYGVALVNYNSSSVFFYGNTDNASAATLTTAAVGAGDYIQFSVTYEAEPIT